MHNFEVNQLCSMIDRYLHQVMAGLIRRKGIRTINLLFWDHCSTQWKNSPYLFCQMSSGSWCLYGRLLCFTTSRSTGMCLARLGINQPFNTLGWDDVLCMWLRVCSSLNAKGWPIDLSNLGCHVNVHNLFQDHDYLWLNQPQTNLTTLRD
jgi:hypothetical protein